MQPKIRAVDFSVYFRDECILKSINLALYPNEVLAIIGPARSGKTTFLRCLNRLNDLIPGMHHTGRILLDSADIYDAQVDVTDLRRRVGMVYAVPVPLPKSIYENLAFGPQTQGHQEQGRAG